MSQMLNTIVRLRACNCLCGCSVSLHGHCGVKLQKLTQNSKHMHKHADRAL